MLTRFLQEIDGRPIRVDRASPNKGAAARQASPMGSVPSVNMVPQQIYFAPPPGEYATLPGAIYSPYGPYPAQIMGGPYGAPQPFYADPRGQGPSLYAAPAPGAYQRVPVRNDKH